MWEEEGAFEVDAPSTDEFPLDSISADELREKYVHDAPNPISEYRERGGTAGALDEGHACSAELVWAWEYTVNGLLIPGT